VAKNWFGNSRGPRVTVVEPTDAWKGDDLAPARRLDCARHLRVAIERHVRSVLVAIGRVLPHQTEQVALAEHDHLVEQLAAQSPDEALGLRPVK
jgi:hypothetical protein